MPNPDMSRALKDIASRLEMTREALGVSAAELCRETGIKPNAWSQYTNPEKKRRITMNAVFKLKDRYGVTLEWVYDGDASTLPGRILQKMPKKAA